MNRLTEKPNIGLFVPKESDPQVSVILPAYNAQATLGQTMSSVLSQTVDDLEVLVVDDGSSDETWASALRWQQTDPQRVRVMRHPGGVNRGVAATRNLALDHARGEFIAFIDADDAWFPDKLERQLRAFADTPPHVGVVFSDAWNVRARPGEDWGSAEHWLHPRSAELSARFRGAMGSSAEQLLFQPPGEFHNWVMSPTPLVRACHFADGLRFVGPPRLNTQFEDYLMWLMLALRCEFVALQEPLAWYRVHETQFVSRYVRQARCLHYLQATRELLDILQHDCRNEIEQRVWRERIDRRFADVMVSLLCRYAPPRSSMIGSVWPGDVLPLLRLGRHYSMLFPMMRALTVRLAEASGHRLRTNRLVHGARRLLRG